MKRIREWADAHFKLFIAILFGFCLLISILTGLAFAADLNLAWDPSEGATGYKVQFSTDLGATWSEPRDAGNSVTFTWLGAPDTGLVLFRASAYNAQGEATNYKKGAWYRGDWGAPAPPVEIIETKPGIFREVPWKDTRSRPEIIADLQREVDDWRTNMIRQFTDKIDAHAEALKSLIEEQVK